MLWLQSFCLLRVLADLGPSRWRLPDSGAVWDRRHLRSPGWLPDPPKDAHGELHPCKDRQNPAFNPNTFTIYHLLQVKTCFMGVLMIILQIAALTQWELPGVWHTLMHDLRPEGTWRGTLGRSLPHLEEAVEVNLPTAWWPTGRCGTESPPSQSAPTGSHYSTFQSRETRSQESEEEREKKITDRIFLEQTKKLAELKSRPAEVLPLPSLPNKLVWQASGSWAN